MEVVNENSLGDLKLKAHSATEQTPNNDNVKCNGDVNGEEEMETGDVSPCNGDSSAAPQEDEPMNCSENGVEPEEEESSPSETGPTDLSQPPIVPQDNHVSSGEGADEDLDDEEDEKEEAEGESGVDSNNAISPQAEEPEDCSTKPKENNSSEPDKITPEDDDMEEDFEQEDESEPVPVSVERVQPDSSTCTSIMADSPSQHSEPKEEVDKSSEEANEDKDREGQDEEDDEEGEGEDDDDDTIDLVTPVKDSDGTDPRLESTPDKGSSSKKKKPVPMSNVTPRRSSRNLNKTKSYVDESEVKSEDDDEVHEVAEQQKAVTIQPATTIMKKNTIVVNDTKRLAEIAAGSKTAAAKGGKKEPTLVIIDTNSLLANKSGQVSLTPSIPSRVSVVPVTSQSLFASKPVKVAAAVSITPPPSAVTKQQILSSRREMPVTASPLQPPPPREQPVILPSLTDDMFVVEAPSFIVPYVYEKPPVNALKEYLKDLEKKVKEEEQEKRKKEEEEEKLREEEERKRKEIQGGGSMELDEQPEKKEDIKMEEDKEEEEDEKKGEVKKEEEKMDVDVKVEEKKDDEKEDVKDEDKDKDKDKDKEKEKDKDKEKDKNKEVEEKDKDKADEKPSDDKEKKEDVAEKPAEERKTTIDLEVLEDKTNKTKSDNYFENPLGKFFMQIGINLVQEHVQTDLLKNQMRKKDKEGSKCSADVHMAISALTKTLEVSKENNKPFRFDLKKCQLCNFRTESQLVMAHHLETPHMKNFVYRCNFCELEVRSPHDILFHMEAEHNVRGRLDRSPAFHQCPNCPFEDNQKGKLSRHLLSCAKKYKPERNQEPPLEWEPPAKIPRVRGARGLPLYPSPNAASLSNAARLAAVPGVSAPLSRLAASQAALAAQRGRGRPPIYVQRYPTSAPSAQKLAAHIRQGVVFRPNQPPVLLPSAPYSLTPSLLQQAQAKSVSNGATAKILQQPSISITPLPRSSSTAAVQASAAAAAATQQPKPGRPPSGATPAKNSFVICEICDGYIKDLEQLRNHMQWIHKVKIHPKMIYNRPPLNCQKCQFRFFTDQGLERHLLGSHGLVTSSMQEAANKGKDGGRCPVCGRVYQWKLLNHVARDHSMSLKPAHLSYKCTVCTATFGMYKQFENHVYSAHSVVAKRVMDKTKPGAPAVPAAQQPSTSNSNESMLKPLKINDEITIIPQPARAKPGVGVKPSGGAGSATVTPTQITNKPPTSK